MTFNTRLLLGLLAVASPAFGQAADPARLKKPLQTKHDPQVYEVTQNGLAMSVEYRDPKQMAMEFMKDAQQYQWSPAQQMEKAAKVPPGGYLTCAWARSTALLASAANFSVLIEASDGREIQRWQPEATVPQILVLGDAKLYTEVALVPLPEPLADGTRVIVIEATAKKRFEYVIHP